MIRCEVRNWVAGVHNAAAQGRDQADGALDSANVLRPSASPYISLRRAPRRLDLANVVGVRRANATLCQGGWVGGAAK